jgi:hypothetical protein
MKNRFPIFLLTASCLLLLSACKSVTLYTVRQTEMLQPKTAKVEVFGPGEQPAIVVLLPKHSGWRQKVGTVWVIDALTGSNAWSESRFMRENSTNYFIPQGLAVDSYMATLMVDGESVAGANFDVR